ncbi:MAG: hypothetical protein WCG96_02065 [Actinomycetes bacterium]
MSWVRVGKVLGVLVALIVLFIITISDSPLRAPVIAVVALAVLVAAGNWLNDWFGIKRKSPEFEHLDRRNSDEGDQGTP